MQKNLQHFIVLEVFGPSGEAQTRGLVVPNHAFYQLNYTRIFHFCHDTTASGKNKVFSVCGHLCGQSRFYTAFGNRGKSRKRRCYKALRRFASPYPGYRHGTPKYRAAVHVRRYPCDCNVEKKPSVVSPKAFWQREKDSNPHIRSQSPLCYHYTIPLCSDEQRLLYAFL